MPATLFFSIACNRRLMSHFPEIGERLRQHRQTNKLTTEEVAQHLGISRALLYRYECGDIVKLGTLERLAALYGTSTSTLLGLNNEYVRHGVTFFERLLHLEEHASHITCVFGPIAYLLTSDEYDSALWENLTRAATTGEGTVTMAEVDRLMYLLRKRKDTFMRVQPSLTSIVPCGDIQRYLCFGSGEHETLSTQAYRRSRMLARREMLHLMNLLRDSPNHVRIGLTDSPLTTGGFSRLTLPNRAISVTSPFRLSAPTNVKYGVATFSEQDDALKGHDSLANHIWANALTGKAAANKVLAMIEAYAI